jgi:hypothetical protein
MVAIDRVASGYLAADWAAVNWIVCEVSGSPWRAQFYRALFLCGLRFEMPLLPDLVP